MLLEPFQTADGGVHWDRVPAGKYIGDLACALPKDEAAHCQTRTRWLDDRDLVIFACRGASKHET